MADDIGEALQLVIGVLKVGRALGDLLLQIRTMAMAANTTSAMAPTSVVASSQRPVLRLRAERSARRSCSIWRISPLTVTKSAISWRPAVSRTIASAPELSPDWASSVMRCNSSCFVATICVSLAARVAWSGLSATSRVNSSMRGVMRSKLCW